ncbi:MAG: hypothetical protein NDI81_11945 [Desulfobacula sp.]|nr:hypothetical protein [Desulfobacula sp.]
MMDVESVSAPEIREKIRQKSALLVCAYEDEEKFKTFPLEGAISFTEFQSKIGELNKDQEIFFYCN